MCRLYTINSIQLFTLNVYYVYCTFCRAIQNTNQTPRQTKSDLSQTEYWLTEPTESNSTEPNRSVPNRTEPKLTKTKPYICRFRTEPSHTWLKSNQLEANRTKSNRTEQIKRNEARVKPKPTEDYRTEPSQTPNQTETKPGQIKLSGSQVE